MLWWLAVCSGCQNTTTLARGTATGVSKLHLNLGETENERKLRSEHERSTAALCSPPQSHADEENENYPTTKVFEDGSQRRLDEVLYRHYIDSSGGQSGSPVYILGTDITDSITYSIVGIHVGQWDISAMGFNVCVSASTLQCRE